MRRRSPTQMQNQLDALRDENRRLEDYADHVDRRQGTLQRQITDLTNEVVRLKAENAYLLQLAGRTLVEGDQEVAE